MLCFRAETLLKMEAAAQLLIRRPRSGGRGIPLLGIGRLFLLARLTESSPLGFVLGLCSLRGIHADVLTCPCADVCVHACMRIYV